MNATRQGMRGSHLWMRTWLTHRTVLFFLVISVAWVMWFGYASVTSKSKLDPALLSQLSANELVNIAVELRFQPEEFHIRLLQQEATVTGVRGTWVYLARVRPKLVWSIARQYWVKRVTREAQ